MTVPPAPDPEKNHDMPPINTENPVGYVEVTNLPTSDRVNELVALARTGMGLPDVFPAAHGAVTQLAALAAAADCGGVNCGRCQQCLTVNFAFAQMAIENLERKAAAADQLADALKDAKIIAETAPVTENPRVAFNRIIVRVTAALAQYRQTQEGK